MAGRVSKVASYEFRSRVVLVSGWERRPSITATITAAHRLTLPVPVTHNLHEGLRPAAAHRAALVDHVLAVWRSEAAVLAHV